MIKFDFRNENGLIVVDLLSSPSPFSVFMVNCVMVLLMITGKLELSYSLVIDRWALVITHLNTCIFAPFIYAAVC